MSPENITKDIFNDQPDGGCNCKASQRIWNLPSKKHVDAITVEEGEIDMFLQFLGTNITLCICSTQYIVILLLLFTFVHIHFKLQSN
jgi:hypothetical protein